MEQLNFYQLVELKLVNVDEQDFIADGAYEAHQQRLGCDEWNFRQNEQVQISYNGSSNNGERIGQLREDIKQNRIKQRNKYRQVKKLKIELTDCVDSSNSADIGRSIDVLEDDIETLELIVKDKKNQLRDVRATHPKDQNRD